MEHTTDSQALRDALSARDLELGESVLLRREIDAPIGDVWYAISQPGHLQQCHPFCRENEVERWPGAGAVDTITYHSGLHFQRDFVDWVEGLGYDIEIGRPPDKTALVTWRLSALDSARSALAIEVTPYLRSALPADQKRSYQERSFGKSVEAYLDSVLRGVEHFVTTGTPVGKNQFGSHPIYSD